MSYCNTSWKLFELISFTSELVNIVDLIFRCQIYSGNYELYMSFCASLIYLRKVFLICFKFCGRRRFVYDANLHSETFTSIKLLSGLSTFVYNEPITFHVTTAKYKKLKSFQNHHPGLSKISSPSVKCLQRRHSYFNSIRARSIFINEMPFEMQVPIHFGLSVVSLPIHTLPRLLILCSYRIDNNRTHILPISIST